MAGAMDLGTLEARIVADIRNFQQNIGKAQSTMADFGKSTTTGLNSMAQKFRTFGYLATSAVTLPMVAAGKASFDMAKNYEFTMQKIVGLAGVAQSAVNDWNKEVLRLSPEVAKGPRELAESLYFISSSGVKGARALDVLNVSAKAASAGLGETQGVANLVTSALNAYASTGLTAAEVTDILVAAVREGKAESSSFAASVGQIIPIASELGVPLDQVAGGMAAITLTGSSASQAATYLKGVFNSLLKATMHGEQALNSMGSSYEELRDILRNQGVIAVMQKVRDLSVEYGETLSSEVFPNIRALTGFLSISGKNFEYNKGVMDRVKNSAGSLDTAWNSVANTIQIKLQTSIAKLNVAMINVGYVIANAILPFIEKLTTSFSNLYDWFNNLSEGWKGMIMFMTKFLVLMGPLSLALSLATYWFSGMIQIFYAFKKAALFVYASIIQVNTASKLAIAINETWIATNILLTQGFGALRIAMLAASPATWALMIVGAVAAVAALAFGISKLIGKKKELSSVQKINEKNQSELNKTLTEEQNILSVLYSALTNSNTPAEVRKELIKEFNTRYAEYLPNVLTETASLEELYKVYQNVNDSLVRRIKLQAQLDVAKEYSTEQVKVQQDLVRLYKELAQVRNSGGGMLAASGEKAIRSKIAEKKQEYIDLGEAVKSVSEEIVKLKKEDASFKLDYSKLGNVLDLSKFIVGNTKKAAEQAEKYYEAWNKAKSAINSTAFGLGIIETLQGKITRAEEERAKAKTPEGIAKAQSDIIRYQRELDKYDPEKVLARQLQTNRAKQSIQESNVKALMLSTEEEEKRLFEIKLYWLDQEILAEKGNADKLKELQAQRIALLTDNFVRLQKNAVNKKLAFQEASFALEQMKADVFAKYTIANDEKREQQIEANRINREKKVLAATKAYNLFMGISDPNIAVREYQLMVDEFNNSDEARLEIKRQLKEKANAMETEAGQLAQLQIDSLVISDKEADRRRRQILIDFWIFKKLGSKESNDILYSMSRDELNRTKDLLEQEIEITKDAAARKDAIEKLTVVNAQLRMKAAADRMKGFAEVLNQQFTDLAQNMAVSLGTSIGEMISGTGGIEEAFNAILGVIADFLIGLGKAMVTTGTVITAFKAALESLQPEVAVVLGIAAIAAGVALKNYVQKGPQFNSPTPMADGGVLYGPTNVLAGEYSGARNNPEVIAPLNKLKSLIQVSNPLDNHRLVAEISGRKLQIILLREEEYQNRGKR